LADALQKADLVVIPSIPDPEKFAEDDRLDPDKLVEEIKSKGTEAWYLGEVDEIVSHVSGTAREGDVIAVLSNGGFGGIHTKLLEALAE
jgi:UDP-N-acetylmuramate: L-alanyl-gamma-D-glutamyl-meso-diaminopimelate ligase